MLSSTNQKKRLRNKTKEKCFYVPSNPKKYGRRGPAPDDVQANSFVLGKQGHGSEYLLTENFAQDSFNAVEYQASAAVPGQNTDSKGYKKQNTTRENNNRRV